MFWLIQVFLDSILKHYQHILKHLSLRWIIIQRRHILLCLELSGWRAAENKKDPLGVAWYKEEQGKPRVNPIMDWISLLQLPVTQATGHTTQLFKQKIWLMNLSLGNHSSYPEWEEELKAVATNSPSMKNFADIEDMLILASRPPHSRSWFLVLEGTGVRALRPSGLIEEAENRN